MDTLVANRIWVEKACSILLKSYCRKRILFFYGESGIGKTTLLKLFLKKLPPNIPRIFVNFQGNTFGVAEIFYHSGLYLGWDKLPKFTERVCKFAKNRQIELELIEHVKSFNTSGVKKEDLSELRHVLDERFSIEELRGLCLDLSVDFDNLPSQGKTGKAVELVKYLDRRKRIPDLVNHIKKIRPDISLQNASKGLASKPIAGQDFLSVIRDALCTKNLIDQRVVREALTESWFQDLRAFDSPIFIVIDAYEKAVIDARIWINEFFLKDVAQTSQLRVLLAGQEVLQPHNLRWSHCCVFHKLEGIHNAAHWLSLVQAMNLQIPASELVVWLEDVCHTFKGHPMKIMQFIQSSLLY